MITYLHPNFQFDINTMTLMCKRSIYLNDFTPVLKIESPIFPENDTLRWVVRGPWRKGDTITKSELSVQSLSMAELQEAIQN